VSEPASREWLIAAKRAASGGSVVLGGRVPMGPSMTILMAPAPPPRRRIPQTDPSPLFFAPADTGRPLTP